jgi:hypothetical protein
VWYGVVLHSPITVKNTEVWRCVATSIPAGPGDQNNGLGIGLNLGNQTSVLCPHTLQFRRAPSTSTSSDPNHLLSVVRPNRLLNVLRGLFISSAPSSWSRSARPSQYRLRFQSNITADFIKAGATRKAEATSSPFDAPTAQDVHQKTRRSRDSPFATWSNQPLFVRLSSRP